MKPNETSKQLVCHPRSARRAIHTPAEQQLRWLQPGDAPRRDEQETTRDAQQNPVDVDNTMVTGTDMGPGSPDVSSQLQSTGTSYPSTDEMTHLSTEWLHQINPESSLHMPLNMALDQDVTHQSSPDLDLINELIGYSASDDLGTTYMESVVIPPTNSPQQSPSRDGRGVNGRNNRLVPLCPGQPRHWSEDFSSQMRISMQRFEQTLNSRQPWITCCSEARASSLTTPPVVNPITDTTRDSLLAVTQLLLLQTRSIQSWDNGRNGRRLSTGNITVVTLPPAKVLDSLLRAYTSCFDQYFGLLSSELQDPNNIMTHLEHDLKAAGILLLLMIAIGATASPVPEMHTFAIGMAEICRTALPDLMEDDLLHGGPLSFKTNTPPQQLHSNLNLSQQWNHWKGQEMQSRLTYAWVVADQEWSLFYDTSPNFSVDMMTQSMPTSEKLWKATSEGDWAALAPEAFGTQPPICLRDLYTSFMNHELRPGRPTLPLQYLRLLLVPLHGMVCYLRQWLQSFSNCPVRWRKSSQGLSHPAIHAQLDQVQALLPEWFDLAIHSTTNSPAAVSMLVMYHLIALNAMTSFPNIEDALLRGPPDRPQPPNPRGSGPCPLGACPSTIAEDSSEEALVHCGQILRLVRLMLPSDQPLWWSAIVYRVALITIFLSMKRHPRNWLPAVMLGQVVQDSTSSSGTSTSGSVISMMSNSLFTDRVDAQPHHRPVALNNVAPDHPELLHFIKYKEGEPFIADRDGQLIELRRCRDVMSFFIDLADVGHRPALHATNFQVSVKDSLEQLADRWGFLSLHKI
ncbi:unnamed protein product [Penicillium viridicatum]